MKLRSMKTSEWILMVSLLAVGGVLSSCFTGIEGTKQIRMSREERKLVEPTAEEKFLGAVEGEPVGEWSPGKRFVVADERASLVLRPLGGSPEASELTGDTVRYTSMHYSNSIDGTRQLVIEFEKEREEGGVWGYAFTGGYTESDGETLTSSRIPMLIDLDMVDKADALMRGRKLYLLSPNWYGEEERRIAGEKFVEAEILGVRPGTMVFPAEVEFRTERDGREGRYLMSFGNTGHDSRSFASLFSLTDPKKRYPGISETSWRNIQSGKVETGMTKEECRLALGAPSDSNSGRDYSRTLDIWQYEDGTILFFEDGVLTRTRIGGEIKQ